VYFAKWRVAYRPELSLDSSPTKAILREWVNLGRLVVRRASLRNRGFNLLAKADLDNEPF
jgi:hypothetical protein